MHTYDVTLVGKTPLLLHADNLEFKRLVQLWQRDPANKDLSVAGDDRSPAWTWIGSLYHDGDVVSLTQDMFMGAILKAGAEVKEASGKKSMKERTQSGMGCLEQYAPISSNGVRFKMKAIDPLMKELDFDVHLATVKALGFALDVRRVRVGMSKHVRVRPVFMPWSASLQMNVWDQMLTAEVLQQLMTIAGDRKGIGEWRPSSRMPGPFGRFAVELKKAKAAA